MVFTYSFIVWTEYHEQMNSIIEKIKFNTKDYWGSPRGFRFRCRVEAFSHTIELNADDDRIVKTSFDLITNGYILPESYQLLDRQFPTTDKFFTPKKIIMGTEMVSTEYDLSIKNNTSNLWKSKKYPNINTDEEPEGPNATWGDSKTGTSKASDTVAQILQSLKTITDTTEQDAKTPLWQPAPKYSTSPGRIGWMAYDNSYLYIYTGIKWVRISLANFSEYD